jgi:hypothetical protein
MRCKSHVSNKFAQDDDEDEEIEAEEEWEDEDGDAAAADRLRGWRGARSAEETAARLIVEAELAAAEIKARGPGAVIRAPSCIVCVERR